MAGGTNPRREAAACVERGIERYAEGQFAAAQRELEAALSLHPGHPRAIECLAWVREIAAGRRAPSSDRYAVIEADDYGPTPLEPMRAGIPTRTTGTRILRPSSSQQLRAQSGAPAAGPTAAVFVPASPEETGRRTQLGMAATRLRPGPVSEIASTQQFRAQGRASTSSPSVVGAANASESLDQAEDTPDTVTREWSSVSTSNLPQLDVPELSEDQIANLLDTGRSQSITLSAGQLDLSEVESDREELERTSVRAASEIAGDDASIAGDGLSIDRDGPSTDRDGPSQVYEMVAEPEEDDPGSPFDIMRYPIITPSDPVLTPLASTQAPVQRARTSGSTAKTSRSSQQLRSSRSDTATQRVESLSTPSSDQTSDEPSSLPTNPFVQQKLASLAPLLMGPSGLEQLEHALRHGDVHEIYDLAEQLAERGAGGRTDEDLLVRAYTTVIGDLAAVPRFGKPSSELDARSAFLLSRMDGSMSIDDLLDVSGMTRRDALRVLARLVHAGSVLT